jgi:hypothetical protein
MESPSAALPTFKNRTAEKGRKSGEITLKVAKLPIYPAPKRPANWRKERKHEHPTYRNRKPDQGRL